MGTVETLIVFSALMAIIAVVAVALDWVGKPLRHRRFIPRIYRFEDEIPQLDAGPGRAAGAIAPVHHGPPIVVPPAPIAAGAIAYVPTTNAAIPAAAAPVPPRPPVVVASLDSVPNPTTPGVDDLPIEQPPVAEPATNGRTDLLPLELDTALDHSDGTDTGRRNDDVTTVVVPEETHDEIVTVVDQEPDDDKTEPVAIGPIQIPGAPPAEAAPAGSAFADAIAAHEEPALPGRSTIAKAAAGGLEPEWHPGMQLDERISGERPTLEAKAARFWRTLAVRMEAVDANERHFNDRAITAMHDGRPPRRRNPRTGAMELPELIGLRVASDPGDVQVQWPSDAVDPWGDA